MTTHFPTSDDLEYDPPRGEREPCPRLRPGVIGGIWRFKASSERFQNEPSAVFLDLLQRRDSYQRVAQGINEMMFLSHGSSFFGGWWDAPGHAYLNADLLVPVKLALIHSEISEAMEAHRKSQMDDKLPDRPGIEVELADALHRIFDLAGALNLDLGGAYVEKAKFNATRADHKPENRAARGGKSY